MFGSFVLLILVNFIGICLSYGEGFPYGPPYGQQKPPYGPPESKGLPYVCSLPPETGPCMPLVAIPRYYYNIKSGQCELFYYGGCEGNPNNFKTLKECQQCCPIYTSNVCPKVNVTTCQSPVNSVTGQCLGGSKITECGTACPLICGQPRPQFCTEQCVIGVCQCPSDYFRRVSDCQCVKQECCYRYGWDKRYAGGQYPIQCTPPKNPVK